MSGNLDANSSSLARRLLRQDSHFNQVGAQRRIGGRFNQPYHVSRIRMVGIDDSDP